jgi:hypothetical protein
VLNAGTIYSTVFEPAEGRIWLRAGDDAGRPFVPLAVPGATRPRGAAARGELVLAGGNAPARG